MCVAALHNWTDVIAETSHRIRLVLCTGKSGIINEEEQYSWAGYWIVLEIRFFDVGSSFGREIGFDV